MDHRTERLSEAIREELTELIGYEMSDPRLAGVGISDVQISPDKRRVVIRFAVATAAEAKPAMDALEHAKPYIRSELAKRLDMFRIPDLYFEADATAMMGERLQHILRRIKKGRPRDAGEEPEKKPSE
jgi:ribosome-binding factor A